MDQILQTLAEQIYVAPIAAWLIALLGGVASGGANIVGAILQNERAKDVMAQGEHYRKIGMEGMDTLLSQRKMAYDNMWKMIYGGVKGTDFNQMYEDQAGYGFTRGRPDFEAGTDDGGYATSTDNQESTEKDLATSEKDYEESTMDRIDPTQTHGPNPNEGMNLPHADTLHSVLQKTTGMSLSKKKKKANMQFTR